MELKPITHFFNKRIYLVPSYQRGYSWKEKEVLELLTDIKHAIKLNSEHYTGTITLQKQNGTEKIGLSNYELYHVVDGQQRLTTVIFKIMGTKKLRDVHQYFATTLFFL